MTETDLDAGGLMSGELTLVGQLRTASNVTVLCELSGPGVEGMRVVYKPVRGEQPLWDFPDGTLADREVAAFLISEELGWGCIPETVLRDGPLGPGMVQRWITPSGAGAEESEPGAVGLCAPERIPDQYLPVLEALDTQGNPVVLVHADTDSLRRIAVLDVILNNADRKGGHVLEGGFGVDHGLCLHSEPKLRTVLWGWAGEAIDPALLGDVRVFAEHVPGALADRLARHVTDEEIAALIERTERLLAEGVFPFPSTARPIPWPAL